MPVPVENIAGKSSQLGAQSRSMTTGKELPSRKRTFDEIAGSDDDEGADEYRGWTELEEIGLVDTEDGTADVVVIE